ncbi:dTDP-4-dehydrorhamnose reductase [Paenibacillus hamazuiensis]|uniref:dTDP-4-dehydrorhamnose reductase n=1 Tax=Paenibacillus hamazuiensis TaxID=2936508 RepID=UPI0020104B54|nr:dTDP-4-dehydrorhamnose reductase [Paenibacillus hamazuiensis]
MKIAITGAGGQLGKDLVRTLAPGHEIFAFTRAELNVANERAVSETFAKVKPDVIIHAAAYTQVDRAEREPEAVYTVNSFGSRNVALAAKHTGAKLVYISTDYVFDGKKEGAYKESDWTNPLSVYGSSKLHGEKFTELICDRYYIVRTSWLYGKYGDNFVTKVVSLAEKQQVLAMVCDQFGSPTYTLDLAEFISALIETDRYGVYHASNRGVCSRYEFAQHILKAAGLTNVVLKPVSSDSFPASAIRPVNSALDDEAIRVNNLPPLREWVPALYDFIRNDLNYAGVRKEKEGMNDD